MEILKFIDEVNSMNDNLENVILENNKVAADMRRQILTLKRAKLESEIKIPTINKKDTNVKEVKQIEDDYKFYYQPIINITDSEMPFNDLKNEIFNYLPIFENGKMNNAIYRIKLEILRVIQELEVIACNELDSEMLKLIKSEIEFNKRKLECIDLIANEEIKSSSDKKTQNNKLMFLETSSGNYKVFSDLKDIPVDYYESFKELFNSIIDGSFKNLKAFNSIHKSINGVVEVKNFKTRIVFDRINKDTFIILSCFMKDFDANKYYFESLANIISNYRNNADYYKILALNDDYMKEEKSIQDEVFNVLNGAKVKKIGDING